MRRSCSGPERPPTSGTAGLFLDAGGLKDHDNGSGEMNATSSPAIEKPAVSLVEQA